MKKLFSTLSLAATLMFSGSLAHADQISFVGADTFSNDGKIQFDNTSFELGTADGIFKPYAGSVASFTDFNFKTYGSGTPKIVIQAYNFFTGKYLTYTLDTDGYSYSYTPDTAPGAAKGEMNLEIAGDGFFTFDGKSQDTAEGSFNLSTQGVPGGKSSVTFSETDYTAVTPEPSSLLLLGTGLVGTAGMLFRRRRAS